MEDSPTYGVTLLAVPPTQQEALSLESQLLATLQQLRLTAGFAALPHVYYHPKARLDATGLHLSHVLGAKAGHQEPHEGIWVEAPTLALAEIAFLEALAETEMQLNTLDPTQFGSRQVASHLALVQEAA